MLRSKFQDFGETHRRLREILEGLENQAALHPRLCMRGVDQGRPIEDGGGRVRVAEHPEDAAESEPRLFVLRAEFEGGEGSARGLVRRPAAQIRSGEQAPWPRLFIVATDGLAERTEHL